MALPGDSGVFSHNWHAVERSIRTVITVAWNNNPQALRRIAHTPLNGKPSPSQFIFYLSMYFME